MQDSEITSETKWFELSPSHKVNLAEKAMKNISKIYPIKENRKIRLRYSGHFKNYNSNARYSKDFIEFNLSSNWKDVDEDIQVGVIESLIIRVHRLRNIKTENMKLYETFMKSLSKYAKKHTHDPTLSESFDRINEKFFDGMMEKPNLIFAQESFSKLGSYEYGSDTIHISRIFENLPINEIKYLDYVMYHELLHKKHSFNVKNGRHQAHTTAFRKDEAKFSHGMEEELGKWLRKKKYSLKNVFKMW